MSYLYNKRLFAYIAYCFFFCLCFFTRPVISAEKSYSDGQVLASEVYNRADGNDVFSRGLMILIEKGHKPRVREMYTFRLDRENGDVYSLIRFKKPEDIKNTGLLTIDFFDKADTKQWIFLPAVEKSRRISSKRKGGHFVGSDLFYEDLRDRKVDKDKHRIIGNDLVNGMQTIKLESIPTEQGNSAYTKRISWIHPDTLIALRVDFFQGGSSKLIKTTIVKKIKKIQGYWTVLESVTKDLKTLHETHLKVDTIVYDRKLTVDLFTAKYLEDPQREKNIIKQNTGK